MHWIENFTEEKKIRTSQRYSDHALIVLLESVPKTDVYIYEFGRQGYSEPIFRLVYDKVTGKLYVSNLIRGFLDGKTAYIRHQPRLPQYTTKPFQVFNMHVSMCV